MSGETFTLNHLGPEEQVASVNVPPMVLVILAAMVVHLIVLGGPGMRVQDTVVGLEILDDPLNLQMALADLASTALVDLVTLEKAISAEVVTRTFDVPGAPMIQALHGTAAALKFLALQISQAASRINCQFRGLY